MSTPHGVIFDLDGTLVDSLAMTFDAFNHAITAFGRPAQEPEEIMRHFGKGEGEILALILGREHAGRAYELARDYTDRHLAQGNVPLFAGIAETLAMLRKAGVPLAIFTGRSSDTTTLILQHHGLMEHWVTVVCHDHVGQAKPSPEGLLLCCERMGLAPTEVVMIGDSAMDLAAARRAGARSVGVHWDRIAREEKLRLESPHALAATPEALITALRDLGLDF